MAKTPYFFIVFMHGNWPILKNSINMRERERERERESTPQQQMGWKNVIQLLLKKNYKRHIKHTCMELVVQFKKSQFLFILLTHENKIILHKSCQSVNVLRIRSMCFIPTSLKRVALIDIEPKYVLNRPRPTIVSGYFSSNYSF